jgi:hypothetical protein
MRRRVALVLRPALVTLAATFLGGSPACEKCKDEPQAYDFLITPDQFRPESASAGNATSYQEWHDELKAQPCAHACGQLVGQNPITVTSCSSLNADSGTTPLTIRCAWILHACDPNPGCSG